MACPSSSSSSSFTRKRIGRERRMIEQTDSFGLESLGIFVSFGDELSRAVALIVGPEGTPYERGFYLFDIQFPDDYPLHPPHVDFQTGDGRVRFNPNLYVEGKVCLSILGTWPGPGWTTGCNLGSVLVSIQSLLSEHPIQNEPGWEKENGEKDKLYNEIIAYENISIAVLKMLRDAPDRFAVFRPRMRRIFLKHFDSYVNKLNSYVAKEGSSVRSPLWTFPVRYKPDELRTDLSKLLVKLQEEELGASATSVEHNSTLKRPLDSQTQSEECRLKRQKTEADGGQ